MKGVSKVKIFEGKSKKTRADELRDGKLYKFEGEGGSYKNWPLDPDEWEVSEIIDHCTFVSHMSLSL